MTSRVSRWCAGLMCFAVAGCQSAAGLPDNWLNDLVAVREGVWRDWFAGGAGLDSMLTDDFVGIGFGDGPWDSKQSTMAGAKEFAASGAKLTTLTFDKTTTQQFGNVVVVYSNYSLSFSSPGGEETAQRGRATEVFAWRNGRWVHPGWHLD
ncbi:MAG: nuclear transport factor 2 family protein, partial [Gemmatimonadales bacterium]